MQFMITKWLSFDRLCVAMILETANAISLNLKIDSWCRQQRVSNRNFLLKLLDRKSTTTPFSAVSHLPRIL